MELLKQPQFEVLPMEQQVCVLFAANEGYVDSIPLEKVREFESKLLEYLQAHNPDILEAIQKTKDFPEDIQNTLKQAFNEFKETAQN
jgi:F-type H+-transporting ATPase subunit alpha